MTNKGFIKFDEMRIKGKHLKGIPEDQAAMLALLLCAYNETNILLRLYLLNAQEVNEPKPAQWVALSTKMFLARTLSSKIFEVAELLRGKKSWQKSSDPVIQSFRKKAIEKFDNLTKNEGFCIARALRNECTNHYSLKATKKNISGLDDNADLTIFMHKIEGNSFAVAGEAVVFHQRFASQVSPISEPLTDNQFAEWLDWSMLALQWLKETCAEFVFLVLPESVTGSMKWTQVYWPELELFGELDEAKSPIFLHESRS